MKKFFRITFYELDVTYESEVPPRRSYLDHGRIEINFTDRETGEPMLVVVSAKVSIFLAEVSK